MIQEIASCIMAFVGIVSVILFGIVTFKETKNAKDIKKLKNELHDTTWRTYEILAGARWFAYREKDGKQSLWSKSAIKTGENFVGGNKPQLFDEVSDE